MHMAKKIILALIILIVLAFFVLNLIPSEDSVDIYIDGENVSVRTSTSSVDNVNALNEDICEYTASVMNDTSSDINSLKKGIIRICEDYGMGNPQVSVDSSIGENQIPVIVHVDGTSMLPTLQDGQTVLVNKSKDVHVGDIVVAESDEYGGIIKRVGNINGNAVYLESDNKQVNYEVINGQLYASKGITTWVDISDINGVVIQY